MKVYSIDVRVYATAYIKAENEEEALKIARDIKDSAIEVSGGGDIEVSGLSYDNPDLPEVSLSPAMTVDGPDQGDPAEALEMVYDPDDDGEADDDE